MTKRMTRQEENSLCIIEMAKGLSEYNLKGNEYIGLLLADISKSLAIIADSLETRPEMQAAVKIDGEKVTEELKEKIARGTHENARVCYEGAKNE